VQVALTIALFLSTVLMAAPEPDAISPSTALKQRLGPVVQQSLDALCGEDCPGFQLEPIFQKSETVEGLDDLGFPPRAVTSAEPQPLKSVSVRLLVKNTLPKEQVESLRKTVAYRTSNAIDVPVSVSVENVPGMQKAKDAEVSKEPETALAWARQLAWPSALLLLGVLSLVGLVAALRHRWAVITRTTPSPEDVKEEFTPSFDRERAVLDALLVSRKDDLRWLIENAAENSKTDSLDKIAAAYPADALSGGIDFSELALAKLSAVSTTSKSQPLDQLLQWTERALDEAHWSRKREEKSIGERLGRLSLRQLKSLLHKLPGGDARAFFFASVSKDSWPALLSTLESSARVELGVALATLHALTPGRQVELEQAIDQAMASANARRGQPTEKSSELVQDYSLYLSEDEGSGLWRTLSTQKLGVAKPANLDTLLLRLSDEALLELYMHLDLAGIKASMRYSSASVRQRVISVLPEKLRERIGNLPMADSTQAATDPDWIKARASLLGSYRAQENQGGAWN
jgi:hypothetical protein